MKSTSQLPSISPPAAAAAAATAAGLNVEMEILEPTEKELNDSRVSKVTVIYPPVLDDKLRAENDQLYATLSEEIKRPEYVAPDSAFLAMQFFGGGRVPQPGDDDDDAAAVAAAAARAQRLYFYAKRKAPIPAAKRTRYAFTEEMDQSLVVLSIAAIKRGEILTTSRPYQEIMNISPHLRHLRDPCLLKRRLEKLSEEDNVDQLEAYCGLNNARTDEERENCRTAAQLVRASCLKYEKLLRFGLEEYTIRESKIRAIVPSRKRRTLLPCTPSTPLVQGLPFPSAAVAAASVSYDTARRKDSATTATTPRVTPLRQQQQQRATPTTSAARSPLSTPEDTFQPKKLRRQT